MTNGLLKYGKIFGHFLIYQEALSQLCNCSTMNFLIYEEKFDFHFYQCMRMADFDDISILLLARQYKNIFSNILSVAFHQCSYMRTDIEMMPDSNPGVHNNRFGALLSELIKLTKRITLLRLKLNKFICTLYCRCQKSDGHRCFKVRLTNKHF